MNTILSNCIDIAVAATATKNIWIGTYLEGVSTLTSDEKGRFGENYFKRLVESCTDFSVLFDGDANFGTNDGKYDIKINSLRVEVKTAFKGNGYNKWQHDVIREGNMWDKLVFLDFDLHGVWITILDYNSLIFKKRVKNPIFNISMTPCKTGWKFDFTTKQQNIGVLNKITTFMPLDSENLGELSKFLKDRFGNV